MDLPTHNFDTSLRMSSKVKHIDTMSTGTIPFVYICQLTNQISKLSIFQTFNRNILHISLGFSNKNTDPSRKVGPDWPVARMSVSTGSPSILGVLFDVAWNQTSATNEQMRKKALKQV